MQCVSTLGLRLGLRLDVGSFGRFAEHRRRDLSARVAINAGGVNEEVARDVGGDAFLDIGHDRPPFDTLYPAGKWCATCPFFAHFLLAALPVVCENMRKLLPTNRRNPSMPSRLRCHALMLFVLSAALGLCPCANA